MIERELSYSLTKYTEQQKPIISVLSQFRESIYGKKKSVFQFGHLPKIDEEDQDENLVIHICFINAAKAK